MASHNTFNNEAISSGHIIFSEILSVTSVMRKNSRWSSSMHTYYTKDSALASNLGLRRPGSNIISTPQQGSREEDLMSGFEELKRTLRSTQGVCSVYDAQDRGETFVCPLDTSSISLTDIIAPFLSIIRSPLSTGPITSAALSALHSFFSYDFFLKNDPSVDVALVAVSSSVSHCKFEASDSSGDEVVLLRILTVIEDCMCGVWGTRLGDIEVCEMLETVLATCVQMRLSGLSFRIISRGNSVHITTEALRRSAELTMHKLVRTILSKLHTLDPVSEEKRLVVVPRVPAAETDTSSPTASGDPVAAGPSANPIAESPQDTSRTQKLDCMLWHCLPFVRPDLDGYLRWTTVDC